MSKYTVFKLAAWLITGWVALKGAGLPADRAEPDPAGQAAEEQNGWLFI